MAHVEYHFSCAAWPETCPSRDVICRSALALLLARHKDAREACFCLAPLPEDANGPRFIHTPVEPGLLIADLYRFVESEPRYHDDSEARPASTDVATPYSTLAVVFLAVSCNASRMPLVPGTCTLLVECCVSLLIGTYGSHNCALRASFIEDQWHPRQAQWFLAQLGHLIGTLPHLPSDGLLVQDVGILSPQEHLHILSTWNATPPPPPLPLCVHDCVSRWAAERPHRSAVAAWDGTLTYEQLECSAMLLAAHLQNSTALAPEQPVLLAFEKSKWVVISMLAVLKAGGVIVLIDSSLPATRIAQIRRQTSAVLALTSASRLPSIRGAMPEDATCILVDDALLSSLPKTPVFQSPAVPSQLAYILFTSGSTGEPKGSMMEHRAFSSSCLRFGPAFGIDERTRSLQFASYAFGACLVEILTTLMLGGCVCIPSEQQRSDAIESFIRRFQVNWAVFTPTFLRAIRPERVPSLRILNVGGEPVTQEARDIWAGHARIVNVYGQSETSTCCIATDITPSTTDFRNIGRPIGARAWIAEVDDTDRLAPIGCTGELVIESRGIARGYLNANKEQASAFLARPPTWFVAEKDQCSPATRFYKTGDLVRYAPDGSIIHIGRKDEQIKIRGQKVELGDVEAQLRRCCPAFVENALVDVIPHPGGSSHLMLVGFLQISKDRDAWHADVDVGASLESIVEGQVAQDVQMALRCLLPPYSIPSHLICVERFPSTASGKVDRLRLRRLASQLLSPRKGDPATLQSERSQTSHTEQKMLQLWASVLQVQPAAIEKNANFFQLGGDSVAAMAICNRAREDGIDIRTQDFFDAPVFKDLVAKVRQLQLSDDELPHIVKRELQGCRVPLSFAQSRLWFLDQLHPNSCAYLIPLATRIKGALIVEALKIALQAMVDRHEMLRTTFEQRDGVASQLVKPRLQINMPVIEVQSYSDAKMMIQREQSTPLNLLDQPWRAVVFKLSAHDHILSIAFHHILIDGWSVDIFCRELSIFYRAAIGEETSSPVLPNLNIDYRDFVLWQREWSTSAECQTQLNYWERELKDFSPSELILDRPRPITLMEPAGLVNFVIAGDLYADVNDFARSGATGVTPFIVLFAAFVAAHFRLTGSVDATVCTPLANRNHKPVQDLLGIFVNTVCIRTRIELEPFGELLEQVRKKFVAAMTNQDAPFDQVASRVQPSSNNNLPTSRTSLDRLVFAFHPQSNLCQLHLGNTVRCDGLPMTFFARSDLEFHIFQEKDAWHGRLHFASELYDHKTVEALVPIFEQTLAQGVRDPHIAVLDIALPMTKAAHRSLDIMHTDYSRESSIIEVFQNQARTRPHALAITDVGSGMTLTYSELDEQSTLLAAWLQQQLSTAPPETIVPVLAHRSCQAITTFLGIMKAHFAYLPLDVKAPSGRLSTILAALPVVSLLFLGPGVKAPQLEMDIQCVAIDDALSSAALSCLRAPSIASPTATSLAYVIFTSGSTGTPKGVQIEHRGVVRLCCQNKAWHQVPSRAKVANMSSLAFDVSTWEIYTPLLNGGSVVCVNESTVLDPEALGNLFRGERVQAAKITPLVLKQCLALAPEALTELEVLYVAGDRLDPATCVAARKVLARGFGNAYGPTENTGASTAYEIGAGQDLTTMCRVPIGSPISNSGACVVDRRVRPVMDGVIGELVVFGDGLARGYLNSGQDHGRFVTLVLDGTSVRAYRTGDRSRRRPQDGAFEFFGRIDQQIKVRGHRVELGEIEHVVESDAAIFDAAVVLQESEGDLEPDLVAFVVTVGEEACRTDALQQEHVESWTHHFEETNSGALDVLHDSELGRDFIGWTSMHDGEPLDKAQMAEWLDDTLGMIRDLQPKHVLEIGTGTGMILFNLGSILQSYVGVEPWGKAVKLIRDRSQRIGDLKGKVRMHEGTALDVSSLGHIQVDTVILNSVVQYFPSAAYLQAVLDRVLSMDGVQCIFIGDVRALSMRPHFLAAKTLHQLGAAASKKQVSEFMAEAATHEEELFVDPVFFTSLATQRPDVIEHVEIRPKLMRSVNELSSFRYAAVLHVRRPENAKIALRDVRNDWLDFCDHFGSYDALRAFIKSTSATRYEIPVAGIPDQRTGRERAILTALQHGTEHDADATGWLGGIAGTTREDAAVSAFQLRDLALDLGYRIQISWARMSSQGGAFDAVFYRDITAPDATRSLFRFPFDRDVQKTSSVPMQRDRSRQIERTVMQRLQSQLPSYMVPSRVAVLSDLPLTASGKVDKRKLAKMAQKLLKANESRPNSNSMPRNELEAKIHEEFSSVLGVSVGIFDSFFGVGGHSLMATRLVARLRRRLSIDIPLSDIFSYASVAALAAHLRKSPLSAAQTVVPLSARSEPSVMSSAQDRLWFVHQTEDQNLPHASFLIPKAIRLKGPFSIDALRSALQSIVMRHEALRTTFELRDGIGVQKVLDSLPQLLTVVDISIGDLVPALEKEQRMRFDFATQPAWRATVYRVDGEEQMHGDEHVLSLVMHHMISDAWSVVIFSRELGEYYRAALQRGHAREPPPSLTIQYRDFAAWEKSPEQQAVNRQQLAYWAKNLAGSRPARLPYDHDHQASHGLQDAEDCVGTADVVRFTIRGHAFHGLLRLARERNMAPFILLLAAFRATHYRFSMAEDAVIGIPVAAHREKAEFAGLIGLFVNVICVRLRIEDDTTIWQLMQHVHQQYLSAIAHQNVPFEQVVAEVLPGTRDLSHNPLACMSFALHSGPDLEFRLHGLECEELPVILSTKWDADFVLTQELDRFEGRVIYAKHLFRRATIEVFAASFQEILECSLLDMDRPIADLALTMNIPGLQFPSALGPQWHYPRDSSVIDVFCEQVDRCRDTVAVQDPATNVQMTYGELDVASSRLATWLRKRQAVAETLVAVFAPRGLYNVVAYLAILKANLAYLPLDTNVPVHRLETILATIPGHRLVLIAPDVQPPALNMDDCELVSVWDTLAEVTTEALPSSSQGLNSSGVEALSPRPSATSLAYVMFTSGSTGEPKGVMIEHRGIVRLVRQNSKSSVDRGNDPPVRIAHVTNLAFDPATLEIFSALLNGGTLVCVDHETVLDPTHLARTFNKFAVQAFVVTPSLLKLCLAMCPAIFQNLTYIHVTGDRFDSRDCRRVRGMFDGLLFNDYGPVENTVLSTRYKVCSSDDFGDIVPIGRPMAHSGALVADRNNRPVGIGVCGELIVFGDGLARGYSNPVLNEGKFITLTLFGSSMRAYRTGDLARYRFDGQIEYLGRKDGQVKLRGHRVELDEIERAILSDARVRDAAVVVRERESQELELVAFVTVTDTSDTSVALDPGSKCAALAQCPPVEVDLKQKLRSMLPAYMVPSQLVLLQRMPTNTRGKIDRAELQRQALTASEAVVPVTNTAAAPRTASEAAILSIFSEILGTPVGVADNFFEIGGHSLLAVKIAARLSHKLQTMISVRDIFECPTPVGLAARIRSGLAEYRPIPRCLGTQSVELSFAQGRFWILESLGLGRSMYHIPIAVQMHGPLDVEALERAMSDLVERHEMLRTTFEQHEDAGTARQVVHSHRPRTLVIVDVAVVDDLSPALHDHQTRTFDLTKELWRVALFRHTAEHHILSLVFHHATSDAWSIDVLCRELSHAYRAAVRGRRHALPPLATQYRDFAVWQRQQSVLHQEQLEYWSSKLGHSQPLELICDYPRPSVLSGVAECVRFSIEQDVFETILEFSRQKHLTPFVVLLAAFRATIYRMTLVEDATIGTFSAGRDREELAGIVGCFVNTHALRIRVEEQDFATLAREVQDIHLAALVNGDVPFEQMVSKLLPGARNTSRHPLVQLVFALHSELHRELPDLEGLHCEPVPATAPTIQFDAAMHVYQREKSMSGVVLYSADLFHRGTIEGLVSTFSSLLRRALLELDTPLRDLDLADHSDLRDRGLLCGNETAYPQDASVVELFERQVVEHGSRTAVRDVEEEEEVTYEQLDQRAEKVAAWLRERRLRSESIVGVLIPRSCQAIIAYMGILKAGLAYLPLDVHHPPARLAQVLSCVQGHKMVLVGSTVTPPEDALDTEFVAFDEAMTGAAKWPRTCADKAKSSVRPTAASLAYVMFTSGSTGTPKGVMVEHGAIVQLVKGDKTLAQLSAGMRYAHLSSLAFDAATWEIYSALLNGSTVVCISHETVRDAAALSAAFSAAGVQVALLPVALLKSCLCLHPEAISRLSVLLTGGERMQPQDAVRLHEVMPRGAYYACGFTEAAVMSTAHEIGPFPYPSHGPPIGRPIDNCSVYVMDAQLRLVPVGVLGELVIAGAGLARGYLDPHLDHGRFVHIEVDGKRVRAYRTGDRARWRPVDGQLEHFGRITSEIQQVKIRGHRVELEEVECAVCACPNVRAAAVVHDPAQNELVAHVVLQVDAASAPARQAILERLQSRLPSFMVPSIYVFVDDLPLNSSGKVDRHELLRRGAAGMETGTNGSGMAQNQLEHALCEEFAAVLGRPRVDVTGTFFDMGGHSLLAMKAAARISRRFDADITAGDIFQAPVIRDLAHKVREKSKLFSAIPRAGHVGPQPLSSAQARLLFLHTTGLDQSHAPTAAYIVPLALRLTGRLDISALAAALDTIEQRHDILRTTYHLPPDGVAVQTVHADFRRELRTIDIHDAEREVPLQLQAERDVAFDLQEHVSWRTLLLCINQDDHVLSIVMHHIASDGWSIDVLRNELQLLYSAALHRGDPLPVLPPLPIQYRDYAMWQRQSEQEAEHQASLHAWKDRLAHSAAAELTCDYPRPAQFCCDAEEVCFSIEGDLYHGLQDFCRKYEVTPFIVLFAVFRATHYRLTGVQDSIIGTPAANRDRAEVEPLIGFFVNILCLRLVLDEETSFKELLQQSRRVTTEALAHQNAPFEQLVSELCAGSRDASRAPLVQLIFAVSSHFRTDDWHLEGLDAEMIAVKPTTQHDLEAHLVEGRNGFKGSMVYATALFHPKTVKNLVSVFSEILRRVLQDPNTCVSDVPLSDGLPELQMQGRLSVQRTAYPRNHSIVDLFREQVLACPQNAAVVDGSVQWCYSELDRASDLLALWLQRSFTFAPETLVVVIAPRCCYTVAAFLGILKAGCAYLPLECDTPSARIGEILCSIYARLGCILLGSADQVLMEDTVRGTNCFTIEAILNTMRQHSTGISPKTAPTATSLAYVMFTSGSTGKPKGVMIEHRGVVRLARNNVATDCIRNGAVVAHLSSIACDASTWEIFPTLLKGGTVVCIPLCTVLDANQLEDYLCRHSVQVATLTPSLLRQLMAARPGVLQSLEVLYVAGDRLAATDCTNARALVRGIVCNAYGPTENTVASTAYQVPRDTPLTSVPIGRAISNSSAFVMDRQRRIVSPGVIGELVVAGDGLARGYIDPAADTDRFINISVEGRICRAYCTGDLARYRTIDGQIEFVGRRDGQVKIRGHRVELTEIEHALLSLPLVSDAAVIMQEERAVTSPGLVAFIVLGDWDATVAQRRGALAQFETQSLQRLRHLLPEYMLPVRIQALETMPLNAGGKIDRHSLTRLAREAWNSLPSGSRAAPRDLLEATVCSTFTAVLGNEVSITDNFFEKGGHSLAAMEVAARLTHGSRLPTSVRDIFEYPTAASLSAKLKSKSNEEVSSNVETCDGYTAFQLLPPDFRRHLVDRQIQPRLNETYQAQVEDIYPTTRLQRTFLSEGKSGIVRPPAVFYVDFSAGVDPKRLHTACIELVKHFNVFRTVFLPINGTICQVVLERVNPVVEQCRVQDLDRAMASSVQVLEQHFVSGSSLLHFAILSLEGNCHRVILCMSHAVYDGLCLSTIVETFHAFARGEKRMPALSFGCYMQHTATARDAGIAHWKSLLFGSKITALEGDRSSATGKEHVRAEKCIRTPFAARNAATAITLATVFTTACGLTLAKISQCDDVVFGRVVSGRQSLPVAYRQLVGPCTNAVPVRLQTRQDRAQLLQAVQDQYLDGIPYETLDFDEIRDNCTDWPRSCEDYWCLTEFMNFAQSPISHLDGERIQLEHVQKDLPPINDLLITAVFDADRLEIKLSVVAQARYSQRLVESALSILSDEMIRGIADREMAL